MGHWNAMALRAESFLLALRLLVNARAFAQIRTHPMRPNGIAEH